MAEPVAQPDRVDDCVEPTRIEVAPTEGGRQRDVLEGGERRDQVECLEHEPDLLATGEAP